MEPAVCAERDINNDIYVIESEGWLCSNPLWSEQVHYLPYLHQTTETL